MPNEYSQKISLGKKESVGDKNYRKIYREIKTVDINFFFKESVDKFFNNKILIK